MEQKCGNILGRSGNEAGDRAPFPTGNDFDALYAVLADSDIMQHYPYAFDEARVRNWINKNRERYRAFGFGLWAVWELSRTIFMTGKT